LVALLIEQRSSETLSQISGLNAGLFMFPKAPFVNRKDADIVLSGQSGRIKDSVTKEEAYGERIWGGLWGAAVGDALGVPVEFLSSIHLVHAQFVLI
jgi:hypothetical protein